jgi:prepilin-type N-terminal cleavage/methylation domain-containing protein
MKLNKIRNNNGFTLIELIIALSVVSIILMAFYSIINSSIKHNVKNEKDIKALNIAQSEVESLRNEIKSSNSSINIYDDEGNVLITIAESEDIIWKDNGEKKNIDIVDIITDGKYKDYMADTDKGGKDSSTLQYYRTLDSDPTKYIVKLNLSREKKASKYMYIINVRVSPTNKNFSKKEIVLTTNVLSK